jgi:hypothetical protein
MTKSLLAAALLSTVAAVSFAQTPAAPKAAAVTPAPAAVTVPAVAAAPASTASTPVKHAKKHAPKKVAAAASAAK